MSFIEEHEFVLESPSLEAAAAQSSSVVSLTDMSIKGDNQKASLADNTVRVMVYLLVCVVVSYARGRPLKSCHR